MPRSLALAAGISWCLLPLLASAETRVSSHERPRAARHAAAGVGAGPGLALGALTRGTRIDRLALELRSGPADTRVAASLILSTALAEQDGGLELDVPAGAQVTFLAITMDGERRIAHTEDVEIARPTYDAIVRGIDPEDPGLLELAGSTATTDRLRLRVFPLRRGKPARVELIMTVPQATRFVVDPGARAIPRVDLEVDGTRRSSGALASRRALALPEPVPGALPSEAGDRVTAERALFIDTPPAPELGDDDDEAERLAAERRRRARGMREVRGAVRISEACLRNPLCGVE